MSKRYSVRYGKIGRVGVFSCNGDEEFKRGDAVLVRSERGRELGRVICESTPRTQELFKKAVEVRLLRRAKDGELEGLLPQANEAEHELCQQLIEQHGLKMTLVDVEWIHGREQVIFYYLAERRVDFRALVRDLARQLRTRIEMRQIGARDAAKLLADCGDCGRPSCCANHLVEIPAVTMQMAKLQCSSLESSKITGRCGRLKCCLRYEQAVYEELARADANRRSNAGHACK